MSSPLMQPHHLESLGWTLIHFCWQAAAIAIAYKIADLGLAQALTRGARKATSQTRYLFALAAMLGMFAAAAGTLLYEELRLQRIAAHSVPADTATISSDLATAFFDDAPTPSNSSPTLRANITANLPKPEAFLPWLDGLWMIGVLALSLRTVGGWLVIQRLRTTAIQQVPPDLAASFARLSRRIGVHGRVVLRLSTRIAGPLAVGMVRSLILLPASALTTLNADQLEAVLAHELAHIRRADYLWNILQTMIETLFFFHPAVWWVGSSLRQQRELCCDDIAIASCADPLTYATALLLLEEHRAHELALHSATPGIPLALALDGHQSRISLRARIARILGEPMESTATPRNIAPFSIVGVCAALAFFLLPLPQVLASLRPVPPQAAVSVPPAIPVLPVVKMTPPARVLPAIQPTPAAPKSAAAPQPLPQPAAVAPLVPIPPVAMPSPMPEIPVRSLARLNTNHSFAYDFRIDEAQIAEAKAFARAMSQAVTQAATPASKAGPAPTPHSDYIDQMRAAGYDVDIDQYMAMKIQNVTPEFAKSMAQIGFGKPTEQQLLALKIHGVTPEYVTQLNASGVKLDNFQDVISYRIFRVSPEFIASMKAAGYGDLPAHKLIQLRIQNVTPEFAKTTKQQFTDVTVDELVKLKIFHINDAFIARAKQLGLNPLTVDKLVKLRISGLIEDEASDRHDRSGRDADREKERATREQEREHERDLQQKQKEKDKDKSKDK